VNRWTAPQAPTFAYELNDDGAPHGLKFHDGAKGTDLLLPGSNFTRRFDRPATYDYECAVHPYMTGRVVVRAK